MSHPDNTVPKTMSAMVLSGNGGMDMYEWHTDWPTPTPDADDVLIRVAACGLNNTDVNTRSGWYSKGVSEATTGGSYDTVSCLLYTSPSPRDVEESRMPSSA